MAPPGNFPMFRLATLLARQLSAPIAVYIKQYARSHPRFSRSVCCRCGRTFHECELRFRMWTLALRQPRAVPPLSEQDALESGANLLGEAVVFLLGGLIIMFEVNRQANKQEDKVLEEESQWLAILLSLDELKRELQLQQQDIDRLHDTLRSLAPQHYPAPAPAPSRVPPLAPPEPRPPSEKLPPCPPSEELPPCPPSEELPPCPPAEELPPCPPSEELPPCPPAEELPPCPPAEELPPCPPAEELAPCPPTEELLPCPITEDLCSSPPEDQQDIDKEEGPTDSC